ncbi:CHAT domain-containing protein [Prochlorothrix hollandica]|uniref:CHAT domain-containing protein n=1 Tax=Prochlorothrix hollandica TaxID=1223 RepID=UPI000344D7A7|nr:CHAT domain-containing protein [Prochlorothrix hollandica]
MSFSALGLTTVAAWAMLPLGMPVAVVLLSQGRDAIAPVPPSSSVAHWDPVVTSPLDSLPLDSLTLGRVNLNALNLDSLNLDSLNLDSLNLDRVHLDRVNPALTAILSPVVTPAPGDSRYDLDRGGEFQGVADDRRGSTNLTGDGPVLDREADRRSDRSLPIAQHLPVTPDLPVTPVAALLESGRQHYQEGRYDAALADWETAALHLPGPEYPGADPPLERLQVLNYLAVAHQELGQWPAAAAALGETLGALAAKERRTPAETLLLAQALNGRGNGEFNQGHPDRALATWQAAETHYQQVDNEPGQWGSRLNQARALQALGYYRQAKTQLENLESLLENQPPSGLQVGILRNLGTALEEMGKFETAETVLATALDRSQALDQPWEYHAILLALGNLAHAQGEEDLAMEYYHRAEDQAPSPVLGIQAQLNQLRLLVELEQPTAALTLVEALTPQWATLEPSRWVVYAKLNFAASLMALQTQVGSLSQDLPDSFRLRSPSLDSPALRMPAIAQGLVSALQDARSLGDTRAQAHSLHQLSKLYSQAGQWSEAQTVARQGLTLAQSLAAPDVVAPLAWQVAQAEAILGDRAAALAAYDLAFETLQVLRSDLLSLNPDVQLTFRDTVEPVYRQYVNLLLSPAVPVTQTALHRSRQVMEALQLAELDNYFHDACIDGQPVGVETLDPSAAVIYPIVLADRLEVIVSLPQQPLLHYRQPIAAATITQLVQQFYSLLLRRNQQDAYLAIAQRFYDWLLRPGEVALAAAGVETLVFIPDGALRRLPMGVLHDGEGYVLEHYNLALSPGLQLLSQSDRRSSLTTLGVGLSESRQGFEALPGAAQEVEHLATALGSQVLLNEQFTRQGFTDAVNAHPFSVIHVATHGRFSSDPDQTFLLAWDDRINVRELDQIFASRKEGALTPLDLLVLSACQTAAGDDRAPLGLAGFALKSGARSTLASLWSVDDRATTLLMEAFYREVTQSPVPLSFAEALRQAQLTQIHSDQYSHPFYWAAFVLVGNWL